MTKKDYIVLARALNNSRPIIPSNRRSEPHATQYAQWRKCLDAIAMECKLENDNFKLSIFERAAGAEDEKGV